MKYGLDTLDVDQSVELDGIRNRIAAYASIYGKKTGKKFKTAFKDGKIVVTRVSTEPKNGPIE